MRRFCGALAAALLATAVVSFAQEAKPRAYTLVVSGAK
jgi:hypothetical protein